MISALDPASQQARYSDSSLLEPNFPRRWSDSDVGVDARPGQPGRSLPNPAPGPPLLSLFPSAFLNGLLSRRPRLPSPAGIENASSPSSGPLSEHEKKNDPPTASSQVEDRKWSIC